MTTKPPYKVHVIGLGEKLKRGNEMGCSSSHATKPVSQTQVVSSDTARCAYAVKGEMLTKVVCFDTVRHYRVEISDR